MQFVSGTHEGEAGGDRDRRLSEMREGEKEGASSAANLGVNFIDAERASAA